MNGDDPELSEAISLLFLIRRCKENERGIVLRPELWKVPNPYRDQVFQVVQV